MKVCNIWLLGCLVTLSSATAAGLLIWRQKATTAASNQKASTAASNHQSGVPFESNYELGFPFEFKERRLDLWQGPQWQAVIILTREYYSKQNLDRLFRWYSKRHPDRHEMISASVYTDAKNIRPRVPRTVPMTVTEEGVDPNEKDEEVAVFNRQGDSGIMTPGENEWYRYAPGLDRPNPNQLNTAVIHGKDPFSTKTILETWEPRTKGTKLRIICYELQHAEPIGIYYTLQQGRDPTFWDSVATWRQDERVAIPHDHLRFLNDRIIYFYMGQVYAISIDGGREWSTWEAETDLKDPACCDGVAIQDVRLQTDGTGVMKLALPGRTAELQTNDYGRHWTR